MVRNDVRYCDFCEKEIARGERYMSGLIERDLVPHGLNIAKSGLTVDALGNIRVDLCASCRNLMSLSGDEAVA